MEANKKKITADGRSVRGRLAIFHSHSLQFFILLPLLAYYLSEIPGSSEYKTK